MSSAQQSAKRGRAWVAWERWACVAAGSLGLILLTWVAYGFSLRLPFFLDDMVHFRWLSGRTLPEIWTSARGLGYYRPLNFTLWRGLLWLQGHYDAYAMHSLNLALHLLNAFLVWLLVSGQRRDRDPLPGLAAALLFLLFPFSYQAVPWVGSLCHPLVTALLLGALLLGRTAAMRGARALLAAALLLALLAPFAHETGLLAAPLLVLLLLTREEPCPLRRAFRVGLNFLLCSAVPLTIWLLVPQEPHHTVLFDFSSRWRNLAYLSQGLAYPVSALAHRLVSVMPHFDAFAATALLSGIAISIWALAHWWAGQRHPLLLALGWFALMAAPAWALLGYDYLVDGPRLLYEAAVGAAMFWSLPLQFPLQRGLRPVFARVLAVAVVAFAAAVGWRFIRARVPLYEQMRTVVEQMLAALPESRQETLLCVNVPAWLAPKENTYPLGHEGVALVPDYSRVLDLVWLHTLEERPVRSVELYDVLPREPWRYLYQCTGTWTTSDTIQPELRLARHVLITCYEPTGIVVRDGGGLEASAVPSSSRYRAVFADRLALNHAEVRSAGSGLCLTLYWHCRYPVDAETNVFVHLCDASGRLVAQADGYPVLGTVRILSWQRGDLWRDVRWLDLPEGLAPGEYTVRVGLYPVAGGPRLSALAPDGTRYPDDAVPVAKVSQ